MVPSPNGFPSPVTPNVNAICLEKRISNGECLAATPICLIRRQDFRTRLTILLGLIFILATLAIGCIRKTQFNVTWSFALGTNAVIRMKQDLPARGFYEFTLEFTGVDRAQFVSEKWPLVMNVDLHLLVRTNDQLVLSTNISKLEFSNISDKRKVADYGLPGFIVPNATTVDCTIEDFTRGPARPVQIILLRVLAK